MTALIKYETACRALAEAHSIDEVKDIRDKAEAMRVYAIQSKNVDLEIMASDIRSRGERRLGELLIQAKGDGRLRTGKGDGRLRTSQSIPSEAEGTERIILSDIGIDHKLSSRAQRLGSISEQAFEMLVSQQRERIAGRVPAGARSVMGSRKEPDASLDYSPTPPWATRALVETILPQIDIGRSLLTSVHEPACGEGHMAEVLSEYFESVVATDVAEYGYGLHGADFLDPDAPDHGVDWIITNPPFKKKAEQFALLALERARVGVAIFARLQWLETIGRYERLFRDQPPTQIAFFCERVNLCMGRWEPDGGTATAYIWLVWIKGRAPRAPFWIPPGQQESLTHADDAERFTQHPVAKTSRDEFASPPTDTAGNIIEHDQATGEAA